MDIMSVKTLRPLKIILTACGCPGASTLIRMLKQNGERSIQIIGTDIDPEAIGRFFCDGFYKVPPGTSDGFIPELLNIVRKEKPDLIFPESSNEVLAFAKAREDFESHSTKVLVSEPDSIEISNNKHMMYETVLKKTNITLPKFFPVYSLDEFLDAAAKLDYPERPIVFKPHVGKGSRGVRIIDPHADRKSQLLYEKPNNKFMSMDEFIEIFRHSDKFPNLLVMEFLDGIEKTTDSLSLNGKELLTTVKTVEQARWGVIVRGELIRDEGLIDQTKAIIKAIKLSYCTNIQFIADKLIEINPRVSTFLYQDNLIAPYLAIKLALGEISEEEVSDHITKIDYGRRMVRYMDQIFHKDLERVL